jgi:hypothetical protein
MVLCKEANCDVSFRVLCLCTESCLMPSHLVLLSITQGCQGSDTARRSGLSSTGRFTFEFLFFLFQRGAVTGARGQLGQGHGFPDQLRVSGYHHDQTRRLAARRGGAMRPHRQHPGRQGK